jgi:hypothetical protein
LSKVFKSTTFEQPRSMKKQETKVP